MFKIDALSQFSDACDEAIFTAVRSGEVSVEEANDFVDGFNTSIRQIGTIGLAASLDYIPDEIEVRVKGRVTFEVSAVVTVPFMHEEDGDDVYNALFRMIEEQTTMHVRDGVEVSEMEMDLVDGEYNDDRFGR